MVGFTELHSINDYFGEQAGMKIESIHCGAAANRVFYRVSVKWPEKTPIPLSLGESSSS